ncbi:MAG: hypothetical protein EB107_11355 [Proteobacteria bacterium]|nr:hypothetical protein [Pseudomonadota bacterium]
MRVSDTHATRPNVIVIIADDHGPWALGCAGNAEIMTPNLDRLASTGTSDSDNISRCYAVKPRLNGRSKHH